MKMKMKMFSWVPLFAGLSLTAIAGGCANPYEITVDSHLINCTGVAPTMCMLLSDADDDNQRAHYGGIGGFEYSWCSTHTLMVHDELQPLLADGSTSVPVLDSVVASEFVDGETFTLQLLPGWQRESGLGLIPYQCDGDDDLCADLDTTLGEEINADGTFNETIVVAQFLCENDNPSPRLVSFETQDTNP